MLSLLIENLTESWYYEQQLIFLVVADKQACQVLSCLDVNTYFAYRMNCEASSCLRGHLIEKDILQCSLPSC